MPSLKEEGGPWGGGRFSKDAGVPEEGCDAVAGKGARRSLKKGGATGVPIHSGQRDQRKVIEFYGKEVLPRLRSPSEKAA